MSHTLSTIECLELFSKRVEQLERLRLVRQGMQSTHSMNWDAFSKNLTYRSIEPDEEDLRSFLLSFRQFISKGEPIFISKILNDGVRFLNSNKLQEYLKDAQAAWKESFNRMGAIQVVVNTKNLTGEYVLDLWINGYYFHHDSGKAQELQRLMTDQVPLVRMQFLFAVTRLTQIIFYVGDVIKCGLRENLFHVP